ncbi:diacylglyceryl transferase, partial [Nocardia salmonicida]
AYAIFRFLVEFTRANDTVWLDLTRPQWFLLPGLVLVAVRWTIGYRRGNYDGVLRRKVAA